MIQKVATFVAIALAIFAAIATAQEMTVEETKQLTFLMAGSNNEVRATTNGTEWGVVYTRYEGETANLYFLRTTYDGDVIESHQLLEGEKGEAGYQDPKIAAYPGGWAVTFVYRVTNSEYADSMYLLLLDEKGRKIGQPFFINQNNVSFGITVEPVWTGSMFVVFYTDKTEMDYLGIYAAFVDKKGSRVMEDRLVTPLQDLTYQLNAWTQVMPTANGIAMIVSSGESDENYRRVILMIRGDGQLAYSPGFIGGADAENVSFTSALWNGTGFAFTYYDLIGGDTSDPQIRLFSTKGAWQSKKYVYSSNGVNRVFGAGFDGSNYVVLAYNSGNSTVYGQQLDGKMNPVEQPFMVDDSTFTSHTNRVVSAGSDTFYFATSKKVGFSPNANNLYSTRIRFPHSGKPKVNYFNSAVHEIDGKYYAFLDWHVAGAENVLITTKGGKWTLPAYGFHAVEIEKGKKARFKLIAANKAGKANKKVKLVS